jgi:hypothetical protein
MDYGSIEADWTGGSLAKTAAKEDIERASEAIDL